MAVTTIYKEYDELTKEDLISTELFEHLLSIKDGFEHQQAVTRCISRARELKVTNDFNSNFKQYKIKLAKGSSTSNGRKTDFIEQPIELNCGDWIADGFGVKRSKLNVNNGDYTTEVASPIPILPTEIIENVDSNVEKIRLAYYKNGWKSIVCERATTASNNRIIELANVGIEVNSENSKLLVKYIADCVSLNLAVLPRYKAISRLGWIDKQFMPYDKDIKFDGEKENKYLFESICTKGSYKAWVNYMLPLRENIYLRLQMAASFASPIIEKVNGLPFVFHLWGGTGTGKTVGLMTAMSIWGNPRMGKTVRTMNMTTNSMLSTAAFLCNLPFAGDELQTIKSRWENYDTLIMKITEGIDRGRMSYDKNNEIKSWKCSFLFTGEEPCTKAESGGGVHSRVIEIECIQPVVENGNAVVNFINENYGYAGVEYINSIRNENLLSQFTEIFNEIIQKCDTTEKQAMATAYMLLGDRMAGKYIFKGEKPLSIADIKPYLKSVKEVDVTERAYDFVINLIARNINRFKANDFGEINGEIWGRVEDDFVFINKDILSKEMSAEGFEFDAVKSKWAEKGYIEKNTVGRYIHTKHLYGIRTKCIKINIANNDNENMETDGEPFTS